MEFLIHVEPPRTDRPALRLLRCLQRMTQKDLARAGGISQPTLSRIERGFLPADRRVCQRIAGALGVEASVLFPELARPRNPHADRPQETTAKPANAATAPGGHDVSADETQAGMTEED